MGHGRGRMKTFLLSAASFIIVLQAAISPGVPGPTVQKNQDKSELQYEVVVTLKLVQVFVVDKKGNPVPDLGKEDFVIRDNGRAQVISEFERHSLNLPSPAPESPPANLEPTPLQPPRDLMPRKFIILFDFSYNNPQGIL